MNNSLPSGPRLAACLESLPEPTPLCPSEWRYQRGPDVDHVLRAEKDQICKSEPRVEEFRQDVRGQTFSGPVKKGARELTFEAISRCSTAVTAAGTLSSTCRAVDGAQAEQQDPRQASLQQDQRGGQHPTSHPACLCSQRRLTLCRMELRDRSPLVPAPAQRSSLRLH